jgi:phosphoribosyl 1,2-cyclic phosphodiesterase
VRLKVLGSSSAGNAYVLTLDGGKSLLLDAGVPYRQIVKAVGADWPRLQAALITHEHGDHVSAVPDLIDRGVMVYASAGTARAIDQRFKRKIKNRWGIIPVKHNIPFWTTAGATVTPFNVQHDPVEPLGFIIDDAMARERLVYATDTYYLRYKLRGVHYWLVECNFCDDLATSDDAVDKRRYRSHMSLDRLKAMFRANDLTQARKIVLIHLSNAKSDEKRMVREIAELTGVETVAAHAGDEIKLTKAPF